METAWTEVLIAVSSGWGSEQPSSESREEVNWAPGLCAGVSKLGERGLPGETLAVGASGPSFMWGLGCGPKGRNAQWVCALLQALVSLVLQDPFSPFTLETSSPAQPSSPPVII